MPYVKADVHGGTLELGTKEMTNLNPTEDIVFKLTVKKLDELDISGSGKADVKRLDQDRLQVRISGSGDVSGQGTANDLDLRISGSGSYRGEALKSKQATVGVSGSGNALISASETLHANVSGSGTIGTSVTRRSRRIFRAQGRCTDAERGRSIFRLLIRDASVVGFMPSSAAAPSRP